MQALFNDFRMKDNKTASIITLGFALFAMFFGAGNLILPPYIGLNVGSEWFFAILGFVTTGILAPFLGLLAVTKNGLTFTDLGKRTHPVLILILATIIMWSIGPLVAIPRTGATTFEMALKPVFPAMSPIVGALLFFAVTLILSISPSKIVDIIGKYLTPVLVVLLLLLVMLGIFNPVSLPEESSFSSLKSFQFGFDEGYQTMDVLASVVFAGIIISAAVEKGFDKTKQRVQMVFVSGIVAVFCLFLIYGGLIYLGATSGFDTAAAVSRTELLLIISKNILGNYGTYAVSLAIALACLTTAIALTTAFGTFMEKLTKGKLPYTLNVVICTLLSVYFAIKGVDEIIAYAGALLNFVYPVTFALVLYLLIFGKKVTSKKPYIAAVLMAALIALLSLATHYNIGAPFLMNIKQYLPLEKHNLEWVVPSFVVFVFFALIPGKKKE